MPKMHVFRNFIGFALFCYLLTFAQAEVKQTQFSTNNKTLKVWYSTPKSIDAKTRFLFVMHGVKRNGEDYCKAWQAYCEKHNLLVVVPEFSNEEFPGSSKYNLANMSKNSKEFNQSESWHFGIIEDLFASMKRKLNLSMAKYSIYGHSAGAQFVHRFVLFGSAPHLDLAISANAGWYTFPNSDIAFPYGIKGLANGQAFAKRALGKKMLILLGDKDTDPNHKYLRKAAEAMAQGKHRFARGNSFFLYSQTLAKSLNTEFNWKLATAKGVGHSNSGMAKHAAEWLGKN